MKCRPKSPNHHSLCLKSMQGLTLTAITAAEIPTLLCIIMTKSLELEMKVKVIRSPCELKSKGKDNNSSMQDMTL